MNLNSQTVSRFVFLFFIISISVYFMFVNKNFADELVEKFEEKKKEEQLSKDKQKLAELVKQLYIEIYKDDINNNQPSQKAVDFYVDYAMQRNLTRADFKEVIQGSAPALERTFKDSSAKSPPPNEVFGTEDEVTELYNEILFRNPDEAELYTFAKLVKTDATFSLEKLKQILYASEEYRRLEKTQTNTVYSNLMGGVTDRQLDLIVATTYKNITGKDDLDTDTKKFLRKKLLSFNLNEVTFQKFVESYVKGAPVPPLSENDKKKLQNSLDAVAAANQKKGDSLTKEDMEKFKQDILAEVKNSLKNVPKDPKEGYTHKGQENSQVNPNKQVIEVLLKTAKESERENYLDSQNILDRIKEEAKCVFDKNAVDEHYSSLGKSSLAQLQDQRNTEELRNTCIRNRKFLGVDEDMVLDPSLKWSVPQRHPPVCVGGKNTYQPVVDQTSLIGTLLEEAKDTEVGSILPKVPPR